MTRFVLKFAYFFIITMSHDAKKISFSFSKIKKPSLIVKTDNKPTNKIEYVDCFDGAKGKFSYKGNVK